MTLLYLFTLLIIGFLSSYIFNRQITLFERLSISIGLGILIVSLGLFALLTLGYGLNLYNVLFVLGILMFIEVIFLKINRGTHESFKKDLLLIRKIKINSIKKIFKEERKYVSLIMIVTTIIVFAITILWPISEWDALTLYDFRGRLYAEGLNFSDVQKIDDYFICKTLK